MSVPNEQPIYIDSLVWLPMCEYEPEFITGLKRRLTVLVRDFNPMTKNSVRKIRNYRVDKEGGYFGVPIHFGLQLLQKDDPHQVYELEEGKPARFPKRPDPHHPNASEGQDIMMAAAVQAARDNIAFLIEAPTGSGKTVVGLNAIAEMGRTALVIVASKQLARQWRKQARDILGISERQIGSIEEGVADYKGKSLVVAVVHNLVDREWDDALYDYFGTVLWDEAHRLGAEGFSKSMGMFSAKHRIALTATPERKDGGEALYLDYFGDAAVVGSSDAIPAECHTLRLPCNLKSGIPKPFLINALTKSTLRNQSIVEVIYTMYRDGRRILAVSDRIEQLQSVMGMCEHSGIPIGKMGLFTRSYVDEKGKKKKNSDEQLDKVKADAQIIFATYGMAKEGIDIPDLDAGVELSPQADAIQTIGRIRRPLPNKRLPMWVTVIDVGVPELEQQSNARLNGLMKHNVQVVNYEC